MQDFTARQTHQVPVGRLQGLNNHTASHTTTTHIIFENLFFALISSQLSQYLNLIFLPFFYGLLCRSVAADEGNIAVT
jgi:hypothetical protein